MKTLKYRNKENGEVFDAYQCEDCKKIWKTKSFINEAKEKTDKDYCIACADIWIPKGVVKNA